MFINEQSPTGALSGTGGYPVTGPPYRSGYDWTLIGQLTGYSVSMTITYTNNDQATITGIISLDGNSIIGGAGTGGVQNWVATRV